MAQQCSQCKLEFTCGPNDGLEGCWCDKFPAIMPADFSQACRCPSCLALAIADRIEQTIAEQGCEKMVEVASEYKNGKELIESIDYTMDDGNMVFSKWFHLKRGSCCGNGCRNCPYGTKTIND